MLGAAARHLVGIFSSGKDSQDASDGGEEGESFLLVLLHACQIPCGLGLVQLRDRSFQQDQLLPGVVEVGAELILSRHKGVVDRRFLDPSQILQRHGQVKQARVEPAELVVLLHHLFVSVGRGRVSFFLKVEVTDAVDPHGQFLAHLPEKLFRRRRQLAVREVVQELLQFDLRLAGVGGVPVMRLHEPVVDGGDPHLGVVRAFMGGVENDEVLVLGFCLEQVLLASLLVVGVGDGEERRRCVFALGIGADERLE